MLKNKVAIDFEFNGTKERVLNLVCAAFIEIDSEGNRVKKKVWLHKNKDNMLKLIKKIKFWIDNEYDVIAYAVTAEARSFLSLFDILRPLKRRENEKKLLEVNWIDLYLEWRMLTNHNAKYCYGDQLIDGKVKKLLQIKKAYNRDFKQPKVQHNMAAFLYKMVGVQIDTEHKTRIRDLIISSPDTFTSEEQKWIMDYCLSDVEYLFDGYEAVLKAYKDIFDKDDYLEQLQHMYGRANYAARTAIMESEGYPINVEKTRNFSDSVPSILSEIQLEINELFPDIKPFRVNYRTGKISWNQIATKEWIEKQSSEIKHNWLLTDKGSYSLSKDAFMKKFPFRHDFPKDNFGAQMVRYLNLKQQLNGFLPSKKGKSNFWDYVGSDGRARPYMGIFGSQSSRSQPKATGFMFLKSAWMRSLVEPARGKAICSIDFKSQEFYLGAIITKDKPMLESYESGDPYLSFAKLAGAIPEEGTKKSHPELRDAFKSTTLGKMYKMGNLSLANKLTNDTGKEHTEEDAARLSRLFDDTYRDFTHYTKDFSETKRWRKKYQSLNDGWALFSDNPNQRSIANWPIQTMGAVIMRKSVALAQDAGLNVIFTLHDAIYIEYDYQDVDAVETLRDCMQKAFKETVKNYLPNRDKEIGLDIDVWSLNYEHMDQIILDLHDLGATTKTLYIDPRGAKEYENFKKYFEEPITALL